MDAVVERAASMVAVVGPAPRRMLLLLLDLIDLARRLGRFLPSLVPRPSHPLFRPVRDLVVTAYYDLPDVRRRLGYDPDAWTAPVMRTRAARWADAIAAHDAVLVAPHPPPPLEA